MEAFREPSTQGQISLLNLLSCSTPQRTKIKEKEAKPILKWAGGKRQLLPAICENLPGSIKNGAAFRYIEPFIGGASVYLNLMQAYRVESARISDINPDLINLYRIVRDSVDDVTHSLCVIEREYLNLDSANREAQYYSFRNVFNELRKSEIGKNQASDIKRAALLVFLNKTCFNGLTRYNKKGGFNVPYGKYLNPTICDSENLLAVSRIFSNTEILLGDFSETIHCASERDFIYYDPPYRPISATAKFTAYAAEDFLDADQLRLAEAFRSLHKIGVLQMLSNSDPKNLNPDDNFFDDLYSGFQIRRLPASRMINSDSSKRGPIFEILITNYPR